MYVCYALLSTGLGHTEQTGNKTKTFEKVSKRPSSEFGIPRGSFQDPPVLLTLTNDFPSSNYFNFTLFADDGTLFCKLENSTTTPLSTVLNSELTSCLIWISANKGTIVTVFC